MAEKIALNDVTNSGLITDSITNIDPFVVQATGLSRGVSYELKVSGDNVPLASLGPISGPGNDKVAFDAPGDGTYTFDLYSGGTVVASKAVVVDTTADQGLDLQVSVNDPLVSNAEKTALAFSITGLDADATAVVTFTDAAGVTTTANVAGNGTSTADLTGLADGPIGVTVSASDVAANTATGTGASLVLDTVAPPVPSTLDLSATSDTGKYSDDNLTKNPTIALTGTDGEAGSTIKVYDGTDMLGTAQVDAAGGFSVNVTLNADGHHLLTATATDPAGNESAASAALDVVLDTVAPAAPHDVAVRPNATKTAYYTWQGNGDPAAGDTYEYWLGSDAHTQTTSTQSKNYGLPAVEKQTFHVEAVDLAGNTSAVTDYIYSA